MPGFPMPCLNTIQPIIGSDIHLSIPPPPPAPPAPLPHAVVWVVGLSQKMNFLGMAVGTSKAVSPESGIARPVTACWGNTVARGHDSGPHPAHIFVNALLPQIMIGSSSKAQFASGTVQTQQGPLAVGALWAVNPQLQCGVVPLPSGSAITAANTVRAGFTFNDFFEGLELMVYESAVTWLIGWGLGKLTGVGLRLVGKLASMLKLDVFAKWLVGGFVRGDRVGLEIEYLGRTTTRWKPWKILTLDWVHDFKNPINGFELMHMQYLKSPSALEDFLVTGFGYKTGGPMGASATSSAWGALSKSPYAPDAVIADLFYE